MKVIHDEDGNPITGLKAIAEQQRRRKQQVKDILGRGRDLHDNTRANLTEYAGRDLMIKRTVHQWTPWAISGALATIAAANTIAANLTGDPATTATYTLGGAVALLGITVAAIKARHRWVNKLVPTTPTQRRWVALVVGTAMVWLTVAVITGLHVDTTAPILGVTLMVATLILARKHWEAHHIPDPNTVTPELPPQVLLEITADPEPESEDQDEPEIPERAQVYIERWERSVSGGNQAVPGSRIEFDSMILGGEGEDGKPIEIGIRYLLHLPEVGVTFSSVLGAIPRLEMALRRRAKDLSIEQIVPDDDSEDDPTVVLFEVIDQSPIAKTVPMIESRYKCRRDEHGNVVEGWIECGPYANGDGNAIWRVYSGGDSMWGGFILGGTGSGKSVLLDMIAFSLAASEHTVVWYADGQGGASSPFIDEIADWSTYDHEGWEDLLAALERICAARAVENKKRMKIDPSVRGFTPSPERPGIVVIVDECQLVLDPNTAKRWEDISRIARKVGVALIMATQAAQYESFGRSITLRDQLVAGNVMVLRTTGITQQGFIPGLLMDPTQLPPVPGYGYTVASGGFGRTAPFRSVFCPNYLGLWHAHDYTAATPDKLTDGAANLATDNRYSARNDVTEEEIIADLDQELEYVMRAAGGNANQNDQENAPKIAKPAPRPTDTPPELAGVSKEIQDTGGHTKMDELLAQFAQEIEDNDRMIENAEPLPMDDAPPGIDDLISDLGDAQRQALDFFVTQARNEDTVTATKLAEYLGKSRQRAHSLITALSQKGLVAKGEGNTLTLTTAIQEHLLLPA